MASVESSRRLSPGFAGRLNLAIDLLVLVGSLIAGVWLTGAHYQTESLWFSIAAVAVWVITATALDALCAAYARGETDEFVKPTAIVPAGSSPAQPSIAAARHSRPAAIICSRCCCNRPDSAKRSKIACDS